MKVEVVLTETDIAQELAEAIEARDLPEKFFLGVFLIDAAVEVGDVVEEVGIPGDGVARVSLDDAEDRKGRPERAAVVEAPDEFHDGFPVACRSLESHRPNVLMFQLVALFHQLTSFWNSISTFM